MCIGFLFLDVSEVVSVVFSVKAGTLVPKHAKIRALQAPAGPGNRLQMPSVFDVFSLWPCLLGNLWHRHLLSALQASHLQSVRA